jgi:hypothetical protein
MAAFKSMACAIALSEASALRRSFTLLRTEGVLPPNDVEKSNLTNPRKR